MTQTEFLLDMLKYYSEDTSRRCISDTNLCRYHPSTINHPTSEGCAIGRHLSKELAIELDQEVETDVMSVFHRLPSELQTLGNTFLQDVQDLHDCVRYWFEEGLRDYGKEKLKRIIKRYELQEDLFTAYLS
jgi:hypothetical protein